MEAMGTATEHRVPSGKIDGWPAVYLLPTLDHEKKSRMHDRGLRQPPPVKGYDSLPCFWT